MNEDKREKKTRRERGRGKKRRRKEGEKVGKNEKKQGR